MTDFYNFVEQSKAVWDPVFELHETFANFFFPYYQYRKVLNRKLTITTIRSYREINKGKFPPEKCKDKIYRSVHNIPPPFKYDFDYPLASLSYFDIITVLIKKYVSDEVDRQKFYIKHLECFKDYPISYEIDIYFLEFITKYPQKTSSAANSISRQSHQSFNKSSSRRLVIQEGKVFVVKSKSTSVKSMSIKKDQINIYENV